MLVQWFHVFAMENDLYKNGWKQKLSTGIVFVQNGEIASSIHVVLVLEWIRLFVELLKRKTKITHFLAAYTDA